MTGWAVSAISFFTGEFAWPYTCFVKHVYGYYSETFLCAPDQRA